MTDRVAWRTLLIDQVAPVLWSLPERGHLFCLDTVGCGVSSREYTARGTVLLSPHQLNSMGLEQSIIHCNVHFLWSILK